MKPSRWHLWWCCLAMGTMPFLMGLAGNPPTESLLMPTAAVPVSDATLALNEAELSRKQGFDVVRIQQGPMGLTYAFRGEECPTLEGLERVLHTVAERRILNQVFVVSDVDMKLCNQPLPIQIKLIEFELVLCESECKEYLYFLPDGSYSVKSAPFDDTIAFIKEILRLYREETKGQEVAP